VWAVVYVGDVVGSKESIGEGACSVNRGGR
jgi:hypothetical protein